MKRIIEIVGILIVVIGTSAGIESKTLNFDTRIGMYDMIKVPYRNSRITYGEIIQKFSGRLVHEVFNGTGFTGELNNHRIGLQGIYNNLIPETSKFTFLPFAGFSLTNSDVVQNSISLDIGFDASYRFKKWFLAVMSIEMINFKNSYLFDYNLGLSFIPKKWINLDLLMPGLLADGININGIAFRFNFIFPL